jgi:hypothetical protein
MKELSLLSSPDFHESIGILPKWRIGDSAGGGMNEIYPYYDADQCETILDEVCGISGWGCEYREVANILFCSISVLTDSGMIEKSDAGGARASRKTSITGADKETFEAKTAASSAFVRAASKWGIGRHIDLLPKIQLKVESFVAITPKGERLPNAKMLSDWCNSANPATAHLVAVYKLQQAKFSTNERAMTTLTELRAFCEKGVNDE